jgi:lipopolysaccharide transport system permease protein
VKDNAAGTIRGGIGNGASSDDRSGRIIVIDPARSGRGFGLREAWRTREVLYFLAWRDLKVRYKQTVIGAAWAILQPLIATVIFTVVFGNLAKVPSGGVPYPIFVYVGLLPWTFFSTVLPSSVNSLVANPSLLTKIYVPRLLLPLSAAGVGIADLAVSFSILVVLMIIFMVGPNWQLFMFPAALLLLLIFTTGLGLGLAAVNVRYRDVRYVIPVVLQFLLFLSPVIYPPTFLPGNWRWVLALNPLTGIIQTFRSGLLGHPPLDWASLGISGLVTAGVAYSGLLTFRRLQSTFADQA